MSARLLETTSAQWEEQGAFSLWKSLETEAAFAAVLHNALSEERCATLASSVLSARAEWTADFGGEQYALGRAFYTHFETGRSKQYFAEAGASDARVERVLPGMQRWAIELFGRMLGGRARKRVGFCGPGVHVFPAEEKVARVGGVLHFDTEGLTPYHLARGGGAASLIVMLQVPESGGGLRMWDCCYEGSDEFDDEVLEGEQCTLEYRVGDAVLMDSYRLHQIQPFTGNRERISLTAHAAEVSEGLWEVWF